MPRKLILELTFEDTLSETVQHLIDDLKSSKELSFYCSEFDDHNIVVDNVVGNIEEA